jgi:hypothetical protein
LNCPSSAAQQAAAEGGSSMHKPFDVCLALTPATLRKQFQARSLIQKHFQLGHCKHPASAGVQQTLRCAAAADACVTQYLCCCWPPAAPLRQHHQTAQWPGGVLAPALSAPAQQQAAGICGMCHTCSATVTADRSSQVIWCHAVQNGGLAVLLLLFVLVVIGELPTQ